MSGSQTRPRAWLSWSSGKDSAFALRACLEDSDIDVVGLLTTVNSTADRVAMHAVRRELLQAQADSLGLPLHVVELPWPCPNQVYEQQMHKAIDTAVSDGVERMVFGDLFLADVRAYREQMLAGTGIVPVFPLWQRPTALLADEMVQAGIRAVVTCVDPSQAPRELAGRWFDRELIDSLPPHVDRCGENGEFHTFVADSPSFRYPLEVTVGEVVERDGFVFADVVRT